MSLLPTTATSRGFRAATQPASPAARSGTSTDGLGIAIGIVIVIVAGIILESPEHFIVQVSLAALQTA